jgi:signal transduction histidine kinase
MCWYGEDRMSALPPIDRPRALVIDDHLTVRRLVADTLAHEFSVAIVAGVADVANTTTNGLDLIVVDVAAAKHRADDVIAALRARRELDGIPLLLLSDQADHAARARLLRTGAHDFIVKPFSPEELRARAGNLVTVKRAREAQEKAEAASRAKDEFLAVLSHELRTPLNAILGWLIMLQRADLTPADRQRALDVIDRNARAQARLVEDLLDVSAMIRGRVRLRLDPTPIRPVVAAALDAVRPAAEAKRIALRWHCDDGELIVRADADRLQQVVYNLVGNAIKFTPDGGHVMVQVRDAGEALTISVEDTGIGISRDFLPQVFDRFAQGDTSTTRRTRGLGLGLAIVRHLVELHGGTIDAQSPGEGLGSTFTLRLPSARAQASEAPARPTAVEPVPSPPLLGLRVLLVEQDPESRTTITAGLEQHGAIVASAASVGEATRLLDEFAPDLLLSDVSLPAADGYALLQALQRLGRRIPAIALTSYARPEEKPAPQSEGYWHLVGKPVDIGELVTTISTVAAVRSAGADER